MNRIINISRWSLVCVPALAMLVSCRTADPVETQTAEEPVDYASFQLKSKTGLSPFQYMEAPDRLPNYTPGTEWGVQGEPIRTMQKPLSPEASMQHLVSFPGFEFELFASEPEIIKPLWLAFDHRGRLWIAESVDYPNQLQPEGEGRDRLKIIEDTDDDGKADKFTVFADKLSIPTSFVFANGGVIVVHSGKMEFLKDLDGDDRADERRVIIEGWGTNDTHATVSNLRYGFDNWIWGVVGYSGFAGEVNGKEIRFGQGIFRFKPDGSELEFMRSSNNNTWGLDFTEDNIVIGSTANNNASMYMPIPNRYYESVIGWSAARLETIATSQNIYPITDKVRQVDWHGQYTAGSGSAIYTARHFPQAFWNRAQFVAEPTGHLLGMFFLEREGADFIAHNVQNMLASDDEWCAPIYGEVGPDGALWVVDWYNYIVQHNPTPRGFETGKGNAYETPLRDKTHGRIYRLMNSKQSLSEQPNLDPADPQSLVAGLKSDNKLWRLHSQRLLVERASLDVAPQLTEFIKDSSVDELGLNPAAVHALWTLKGLGALDGNDHPAIIQVAEQALSHPSAGVRRAALMTLPRSENTLESILNLQMLGDSDSQVRLAAFLAISELPSSERAADAVLNAIQDENNSSDRWISDAATAAAARNDAGFLRAFLASASQSDNEQILTGGLRSVVRIVTTHYAERGPVESIIPVLASMKGVSSEVATVVLDGLMQGWPDGISPSPSSSEIQSLEGVMDQLPVEVRDRLLSLGERWKVPGLFEGRMEAVVASLQEQVSDSVAEDESRIAAAQRWVDLKDQPEVTAILLNQITLLSSPELAGGLLNALAGSSDIGTAEAIIESWARFTPSVRRIAVSVLVRRAEWALVLLDAVHEQSIDRSDVAPEQWSQLTQHPSARVAGFAGRLQDSGAAISADRAAVVEELLPLAQRSGDAVRGREVFETNCSACHKINGNGGMIGPDLTGIGSRPKADVLLEILDPNRSVEANYRLWTVSTSDGNAYSGRLEAETQTTVEILELTGEKQIIQRKDIESMQASNMSLMPIGFESIGPEGLTSLLEYLAASH